MLSFGRVPVPFGALPHKVHAAAAEPEPSDDRQYRSRYYAAVLPYAVSGLPHPSSHPTSGSAVHLPSAAVSVRASVIGSASSRFARSSLSSVHSSHSLPSPHRRSQPIDIPAGRRSNAATAHWYRSAWQGAAEETDGSGSSASSGDSDCNVSSDWCVDGRCQLSESFIDDSELQWSGRCLDDSTAQIGDFRGRQQQQPLEEVGQSARWNKRAQRVRYCDSDGEVEDDSDEDGADGSLCWLPFPLLAPSYHVDFELN